MRTCTYKLSYDDFHAAYHSVGLLATQQARIFGITDCLGFNNSFPTCTYPSLGSHITSCALLHALRSPSCVNRAFRWYSASQLAYCEMTVVHAIDAPCSAVPTRPLVDVPASCVHPLRGPQRSTSNIGLIHPSVTSIQHSRRLRVRALV